MNEQRRKAVSELLSSLEEIKTRIEGIAQEERDAFDNLPEGLQQGDKGQVMSDAADKLDEAAGSVETTIGELEEAKGE